MALLLSISWPAAAAACDGGFNTIRSKLHSTVFQFGWGSGDDADKIFNAFVVIILLSAKVTVNPCFMLYTYRLGRRGQSGDVIDDDRPMGDTRHRRKKR